jgi:hypothetical protein
MESIEVWMWVIAGVIIGGLMFTSVMSFMAKQFTQQEINQARESFTRLSSSLKVVCAGGSFSRDTDLYQFPYRVKKMFVQNNTFEGEGRNLCIDIENQDLDCVELEQCTIKMETLDLTQKTDLFYMIQKALGKSSVASIEFDINKNYNQITINWSRRYVK